MNLRPAVLTIISNEQGKVLIGESPRDGGHKFCQGGIDPGETPFEAMKRELFEELGVVLEEHISITEFNETVSYLFPPERAQREDGHGGQKFSVFHIKLKETMSFVVDGQEFGELMWIDPKTVTSFDIRHRSPAYIDALRLCGFF